MTEQVHTGPHLASEKLNAQHRYAAGEELAWLRGMASILPPHWRPWLFTLLAFAGVGVLRWPLIGVLGVLAPFGIAAAWRAGR